MSFYDVISERLAALTGSSTAVEARDALNEFNVRDIQAVSVSEGGGGPAGSGPALIGPFTVNYNDAGIATDGSLIAVLDAGTIVLAVYGVLVVAWDGGTTAVTIALGGSAYGPPDDDYTTLTNINVETPSSFTGGVAFANQLASESGGTVTMAASGGGLTTAGALIAYAPSGTPSQGELTVYALIQAPS